MKKLATAALACLSFLFVAQIPLPPAPTRAHLWAEAGKRLEVDRAIMALIVNDEWLSKRIADAGIADISKTPSNQPLPHDILTGWPPSKRFKLVIIDTEKETQLSTLIKKLESMEKSLDESRKTVALNSAIIQGHIKRIADKIDSSGHTAAVSDDHPEPTLDVPSPAPVPEKPVVSEPATAKPKKPFFPPFNTN